MTTATWPLSSSETSSFAVETRGGAQLTVADGRPRFVVRVADRRSWRWLLKANQYQVAEAFIHGAFDIEGDVIEAVRWWYTNHEPSASAWVMKTLASLRLESWFQTKHRAQQNIEFHYDRSNQFYQLFLDHRLIYSGAYVTDPSMSLEAAQLAKLDHIVRKLDLAPGERFLDVGCGWGALVLHAAGRRGAIATGCTLSTRQLEFATDAIRARGLSDRATIEHRDYRTLDGRFDKIASIGMYEHVGRHRLGEYFKTLAAMMTPNGLLLNSGIARPENSDDDGGTVFLQRSVFPGGEIPYLAETVRAAEEVGLEVLDVENLSRHYAWTCARWVERLQQHRDACLALVGAMTYRTWILYLAGSVISFERGESELYQILCAKRGEGPRRLTRQHMDA